MQSLAGSESNSPIAPSQGHFNPVASSRIVCDNLNSVWQVLRILLKPAGDVIAGQLLAIDARIISKVVI